MSKRSYSKRGLQARWRRRKGRGRRSLCSEASPATSQLRQSFRWRGPLSASQSSPAPSSGGDQWAGTPQGQEQQPYKLLHPTTQEVIRGPKKKKKKSESAKPEVKEPEVEMSRKLAPVTSVFSLSRFTPHSLAPNCSPKSTALQGTANPAGLSQLLSLRLEETKTPDPRTLARKADPLEGPRGLQGPYSMYPINLEKCFSCLFPLGAKSSAPHPPPAQSKLTQSWKPGPLYRREPQDHSGSSLSDS